ncbi:proline-rich receptor-like protein kinase PERK1 isoform X2 [Rutidosis leptorrhynchoides]|uniref:proline-rich receptor-like protein kinase PERK1 isoform X2 n=1 Tax=Rutidosis leptorrhynchoides TaxID=125765 RepID=UPI003A9A4FBF
MSRTLAAIVGGAAGAVALIGVVILVTWLFLCNNRSASRTSEGASSDPSQVGGRPQGVELVIRETRRFEIEELSLATKNFSDKSLIGEGKFGAVYKGLLHDGMLVAIKSRPSPPTQEFIEEARYLASIQHRNIVTLLGYCQANGQQILVYEYVPNGSVSIHLYGEGQVTKEKLEFKHRLSIAIGAAKGVRNFLGRADSASSSSSQITADEIFLAPEVREFKRFSEKSDIYSFGVFLLELVSGKEAVELLSSDSNQNVAEWVQNCQEAGTISSIIDPRLGNSFTTEGMEEYIHLIIGCVEVSSERRPAMSYVVTELDRILDKEMSLTTIMGEGTPVVTLGSQLFRAAK